MLLAAQNPFPTPSSHLLAVMAKNQPPSAPLLALMQGYEAGAISTAPAECQRSRRVTSDRYAGRFARMPYQRSPDPSASRLRRKELADRPAMPPAMRIKLTEAERAYAQLVRERHVQHGYFDLCHDEAAARLGACSKTVKRSQDRLRDLGWITVEERPRPGQKHLSNVVRIISPEWLNWIDHDPRAARARKAAMQAGTVAPAMAARQGDIYVQPRNQVFKKEAIDERSAALAAPNTT
jgi:hypothetical protein